MSDGRIAKICTVHGRVQGVGFRYSAMQRARRFGVSGWVRNMPDGTVETFAQGPKDAVESYVSWLEHGPGTANVERVDEQETRPREEYTSFHIAH
ncbi:MAG: acylphosphatase [Spirochaetia bacterium]